MKNNDAMSLANKVKFWVAAVLSIAGAGFFVANTFAKVSDVKVMQERTEFDRRRLDVLQDRLQSIQEDTKYLRQRIDNMLRSR